MRTHWTSEEVLTLRREWGEVSQRTLRQKLRGRSWIAIQWKAYSLGIKRCPQGHVSLTALARRFGVERPMLRTILTERGVRLFRAYGTRRAKEGQRKFWNELADETEALEAFDHWMSLEWSSDAAARIGCDEQRLRYKANVAGLAQAKRRVRLRPDQWDELARSKPRELKR